MRCSRVRTVARLMIDTTRRRVSEKLNPGASRIRGGPRSSEALKVAKNASTGSPPLRSRQVAPHRLPVALAHHQRRGVRVEPASSRARAALRISIRKWIFGQVHRRGRIERRRPVLDRIATVMGHRIARRQRRIGQWLRRQSLDG